MVVVRGREGMVFALIILSHVPGSEVPREADLSALVLYKTSPAANTGVYPCCEKLSSAVIDGDV